jgi:5-formyltetrahydrofolate cyclo-ligase
MIEASIEDAKAGLRATAHKKRAALYANVKADAAKAAAQHFLASVPFGRDEIVACYWPIRDELDCKPLLTKLVDSGQPVCLPVVIGDGLPLELRLWAEGEPLYPSGFGTLAPPETAPIVEPDVIVMPLLGFDKRGTRLGYGGGYYDRTLTMITKSPRLIGYAFASQELETIPREPHDIPLDAVVTEAGYRAFGGAG